MTAEHEVRPDCFMSGHLYMSYLWLGHCALNPDEYRNGLLAFHQDEDIASHSHEVFLKRIETDRGLILLEQLGRVVSSAQTELGIKLPNNPRQRRSLQAYLAGEVSNQGRIYAHENGLFKDFPPLANVTSPFSNGYLVDGLVRYGKSGKLSKALRNHATMGRLLPGYESLSENRPKLTFGAIPERAATVTILEDVIRRRSNRE